jgi:hypothetical protein
VAPVAGDSRVGAVELSRWVWSGAGGSGGRCPARCGRCPVACSRAAPWARGAPSLAERTQHARASRRRPSPGVPESRERRAGEAGGEGRERGGGCAERGRRSGSRGGRGRVCAPGRRAAGRGTGAPERPASPPARSLCGLRHRHTHPPSAHRPPPPPRLGNPSEPQVPGRLALRCAASRAPLDFLPSPLQPSLVWAATADGRGLGTPRGEGGEDR